MAKKYSRFVDPDHEIKTFRWPYWLLPLLFLSLLLVLGLFIFITIHSTDRFGCFFHCEQKIDNGGVVPPDAPSKHERNENTTELKAEKLASQEKLENDTQSNVQIRVYGKILFPKDRIPESLPNSHLKVTLQDTSIADGSAYDIASTEVDLSLFKKGSTLNFEIKCPMPAVIHPEYSLDAVLNVGWKPSGSDWIKQGDFMTDTTHIVDIKKNKKEYEEDIHLAFYS